MSGKARHDVPLGWVNTLVCFSSFWTEFHQIKKVRARVIAVCYTQLSVDDKYCVPQICLLAIKSRNRRNFNVLRFPYFFRKEPPNL